MLQIDFVVVYAVEISLGFTFKIDFYVVPLQSQEQVPGQVVLSPDHEYPGITVRLALAPSREGGHQEIAVSGGRREGLGQVGPGAAGDRGMVPAPGGEGGQAALVDRVVLDGGRAGGPPREHQGAPGTRAHQERITGRAVRDAPGHRRGGADGEARGRDVAAARRGVGGRSRAESVGPMDPDAEVGAIKDLIGEAIAGGFYNIDVDPSTVVDLSQPTIMEQQANNYRINAELTAFIRNIEPTGVTVSIGGEIGEVGGKNTTVEEFRIFMNNYREELNRKSKDLKGI